MMKKIILSIGCFLIILSSLRFILSAPETNKVHFSIIDILTFVSYDLTIELFGSGVIFFFLYFVLKKREGGKRNEN